MNDLARALAAVSLAGASAFLAFKWLAPVLGLEEKKIFWTPASEVLAMVVFVIVNQAAVLLLKRYVKNSNWDDI